jgi:alkylresorcinol/alkylpyrone synthase
MPFIHSVSCSFPSHYYDQETLIANLKKIWAKSFFNPQRMEEFQRHVGVKGRHLALDLDHYNSLTDFKSKNDAWIKVALEIAEKSVSQLLLDAKLIPTDISLICSNSVTGIAVPTLEARLMNKMPFSPKTKRLPIFGLGCLAGVAGLNRVADYLVGHPTEAAIFLSVELCSLTFQPEDISVANIISTGLFGDGGAAVLMVGDQHPLASTSPLEWLGSESVFFPNSERVMGWDIGEGGFKIILSKDVPEFSSKRVPPALDLFLEGYHLNRSDLNFYLIHPGGPKVLQGLEKALDLKPKDLAYTWQSLSDHGNMSSVSVLFVLNEQIKKHNLPPQNAIGLMMSLGPAFCAELGLVRCKH